MEKQTGSHESPRSSSSESQADIEKKEDEHIEEIRELGITTTEKGKDWLIRELAKHSADTSAKLTKEKKSATTDELTGLQNRRGGKERRQSMAEHYKRYSVLIVDVNDFKNINDTYGHDAGDMALKAVAGYLEENTRKGIDSISRHGGDEFVVEFPGAAADEIREKFDNRGITLEIPKADGTTEKLIVTLSGGIKEYTSRNDFDEALKEADAALYKAKKGGNKGKGRIVIASEAAEEPTASA